MDGRQDTSYQSGGLPTQSSRRSTQFAKRLFHPWFIRFYLSSSLETDFGVFGCVGEKSPQTEALRRNVKLGCEALIWDFFEKGGQVVIYDANNGTVKARQELAEKFDKAGVHVVLLGTSPGSFG